MELVTALSKRSLKTEDIMRLKELGLNSFGRGQDHIWLVRGDKIIPTEARGTYGDFGNMAPENVRFESRVLRVEGVDGHTILMPNGNGYGLPMGENYQRILETIPGELKRTSTYWMDEKFVYPEDVLSVSLKVDDDFYRTLKLHHCSLMANNLFDAYLILGDNSFGFWHNGHFNEGLEGLKNIKFDNLASFFLWGKKAA